MRIGGVIEVDHEELSRKEWRQLFEKLTFIDNDDVEVCAFDNDTDTEVVTMPRGALDLLPKRLKIVDSRVRPLAPKLPYTKALDTNNFTGQIDAVKAMFKYQQGQIRIATGGGKTSIAMSFIASVGTPTLVVVHTKDLLNQWVARAEEEIPGIDVGVIQADTFTIGHLTVATIQTLRKHLGNKKFWKSFGAIIVDECHHSSADGLSWVLNVCPAHYRIGLSASSKRSDGRMPLVRFNVGPVIYKMPFKSQVPIVVKPVFTDFRSSFNATRYPKLVAELVRDEPRNELIARLVEQQTGSVLVLSRQIKHLELIAEQFGPEMDGHYKIVTGGTRLRREYLDALRDGSLRVVLSTQLAEEGLDIPRLSCVVLAFPGTDITTLQKVGRVTRSFVGKQSATVVDITDPYCSVLARQYIQRRAFYRANPKYIKIELPTKGEADGKKEGVGNKGRGSAQGTPGHKGGVFRVRRRGGAQGARGDR